MADEEAPELMTVKETAEYLRIPLPTVYYLVQRGQLPAIQIGGRWRIKRSLLDSEILKKDEGGQPTVLVVDELEPDPTTETVEEPESAVVEEVEVPTSEELDGIDFEGLIQLANDQFAAAQKAQQAGDWAEYGRQIEGLEQTLRQLESVTP